MNPIDYSNSAIPNEQPEETGYHELIRLGDFLNDPAYDCPEALVDSILPGQSLAMLYADPGMGKSALALQLGLDVARGMPFLGKFACRQTGVLVIGVDSPGYDYKRVISRLLQGAAPPEDFSLWPPREGFSITDPDTMAILERHLRAHPGIGLVIIDTLRCIHDGDENTSKEMAQVMKPLRRLTELYGITVLFLHHRAKAGENGPKQERGSTVLRASSDAVFSLSPIHAAPGIKGILLKPEKYRGPDQAPAFKIEHSWGNTTMAFREAPELLGPERQVLDLVAQGHGLIADLLGLTGLSRKKLDACLHGLHTTGKLHKGKRSKADFYSIPNEAAA